MEWQDVVRLLSFLDTKLFGTECEGAFLNEDGGLDFDALQEQISRSRMCELLGIADSTVSGWKQAGRIPRTAAVAIRSFLLLQEAAEEQRQMVREQLGRKIVKRDTGYEIIGAVPRKDGEIEWQALAKDIPDYETARLFARRTSPSFNEFIRSIEFLGGYDFSDDDLFGAEVRSIIVAAEQENVPEDEFDRWRAYLRPEKIDNISLPLEDNQQT